MEKIELTKEHLKDLLHCATGNIKDFVMNEDKFIDDWLKWSNIKTKSN